ncbi:hypothetical protein SKAU_G00397850 [Synaphobranchus kaupii]|uniref:Uncharacterized protein n=1 Tax=Synaphobranchus kaupii TaxID=118154 RepID=A0A9Q1E8F0_SYNKA|nr:hypothetical protein SKAU_G00397850 [Synaphobranchus kaupii]
MGRRSYAKPPVRTLSVRAWGPPKIGGRPLKILRVSALATPPPAGPLGPAGALVQQPSERMGRRSYAKPPVRTLSVRAWGPPKIGGRPLKILRVSALATPPPAGPLGPAGALVQQPSERMGRRSYAKPPVRTLSVRAWGPPKIGGRPLKILRVSALATPPPAGPLGPAVRRPSEEGLGGKEQGKSFRAVPHMSTRRLTGSE